ncbi:FecR family protein [Bacteroides sp. 51]|uniref:FecR family protein n=1 Tax=Bacteroides sp. 51 TaxID=2302938 RepID=UPI0013D5DDE0|nr:FecR domain-containing protein [Bacteroides sp. 51]NDV83191.1 hypothetical protein [Bacteroides sp. 51]
MNRREEIEKNTDRAWNDLYNRLEQDGLLTLDDTRYGRTTQRQATMKWVAGIAALFIGVVSVFVWLNQSAPSATDTLVLHNAKGEPTLVTTFEDGSIIYLGEQASVEYPVHFAENKREVSLQGDAFFEVSKNQERPFIIHTQTAMIEVLGTSFNVKSKDSDAFSLSVRTGKVKVTSKINNQSVYVNAGETALLQAAGLRTLQTSDMEQFNSYLRYIHFKDQKLADIIRIINENTDSVQLKIAPEVGDRRVTIDFKDNTAEDMAQIISLAFGLELTKQQNILYLNQQN